jgi:hypothetical protein
MVNAADTANQLLSEAGVVAAFDELVVSTTDLVIIPPGDYEATCICCRKERRFNRDLLAFKFKIASQGEYFGAVLDAYVNLNFGRGKSRAVPTRSKLAKWLRVIAHFDQTVSTKRFRLSTFANYFFVVRVEPSNTDHVQESCDSLSRVTDIVGVVGRLGRPVQ